MIVIRTGARVVSPLCRVRFVVAACTRRRGLLDFSTVAAFDIAGPLLSPDRLPIPVGSRVRYRFDRRI